MTFIIAYDVREINDFIFKKRKRLNKININAYIILFIFKENEHNVLKKEIKIFKLFFYYNKYMRKIDRFNALIITYINQRACNRN